MRHGRLARVRVPHPEGSGNNGVKAQIGLLSEKGEGSMAGKLGVEG